VLREWHVPGNVRDDALLIVAELVTNAVRHAGGPGRGPDPGHDRARAPGCVLRLGIADRTLRIAVQDASAGPPVLRAGLSLDEGGRGLQLVAGLTGGAWGWRPLARGGGKTAWADLPLPGQERRPYELSPAAREFAGALGRSRAHRDASVHPDVRRTPPIPVADTKETVISTHHRPAEGNAAAVVRQPVAFGTPGRWTITTTGGSSVSGYLPVWAEDDPSEAGVPPDLLPLAFEGICHRGLFEGEVVTVTSAGGPGGWQEEAVFEARITCRPYAPAPAARQPVVDIEVYPGHWLIGLDPAGLTGIATRLRTHADRLDHEVRPALITARTDWAAHH
jgi:hypothetical protein